MGGAGLGLGSCHGRWAGLGVFLAQARPAGHKQPVLACCQGQGLLRDGKCWAELPQVSMLK